MARAAGKNKYFSVYYIVLIVVPENPMEIPKKVRKQFSMQTTL